jgi:ASC-1-like (ASCH) protein
MIHELKTLPKYFEDIKASRKPFEVRINDRFFSVGDECKLIKYDPEVGYFDNEILRIRITYILPLSDVFSIDSDIVVFAFKLI